MNDTSPTAAIKFYRTQRFYLIVAGLIAVIVTPTIIYYELSYNSVNGTHPELVAGYRQIGFGTATFYLTIHVWSWAGSLDTQVTSPAFTLSVDNLPFGTQVVTSGTFQPNNYITYTLTFKSSDSGVAQTVGASNSDNFGLQMSADVSAGWYHELITRSDSATWIFSA